MFKIGDKVISRNNKNQHGRIIDISNLSSNVITVLWDGAEFKEKCYTSEIHLVEKGVKVMNKLEALKLTLEGKKIRQALWMPNEYVCFDGNSMRRENNLPAHTNMYLNDNWEIYIELVSFAIAWKSYEGGKCIRSEFDPLGLWCDKKGENSDFDCWTRKQLRGRWEVK